MNTFSLFAVSLAVGIAALLASGATLHPVEWNLMTGAFLLGQTAIFALLFVLYFVLQKLAGPVYLSQIGSVAALVGLTLATLVLAEPLSMKLLVAAAFVAGGILLVNRGGRAPR